VAGGVVAAVAGGAIAYATVASAGTSLTVRVDGNVQKITTEASTVAGALKDAKLTVSDHDIVAPALATKIHDGTQIGVKHGRLLRELGITVGREDRLSVKAAAALANGQKVVLQRVTRKRLVQIVPIGFGVTRQQDAGMYQGESTVVTAGKRGSAAITYAAVY